MRSSNLQTSRLLDSFAHLLSVSLTMACRSLEYLPRAQLVVACQAGAVSVVTLGQIVKYHFISGKVENPGA